MLGDESAFPPDVVAPHGGTALFAMGRRHDSALGQRYEAPATGDDSGQGHLQAADAGLGGGPHGSAPGSRGASGAPSALEAQNGGSAGADAPGAGGVGDDAARGTLSRLLVKARSDWLSGHEMLLLMRRWREAGLRVQSQITQMPGSGHLVLYDTAATKGFRKDGHEWQQRASSRAVREYHTKIKVGGQQVLNVSYSKLATNPRFLRRIYRRIDDDVPAEEKALAIVHYLEQPAKSGRSSARGPSPHSDTDVSAGGASRPVGYGTEELSDKHLDDFASMIVDRLSSDEAMKDASRAAQSATAAAAVGTGASSSAVDMSWLVPALRVETPALRILDFVPNCAHTTGGAKMLICIQGDPAALESLSSVASGGVYARFGPVAAPCEIITTSTLRCIIPVVTTEGAVTLTLTLLDGTPISDSAAFNFIDPSSGAPSTLVPPEVPPVLASEDSDMSGASPRVMLGRSQTSAVGSGGQRREDRAAMPAWAKEGEDHRVSAISAAGARRRSIREVDSDSDDDGAGMAGAGGGAAAGVRNASDSTRQLKIRVVERLERTLGHAEQATTAGEGDLLDDAQLKTLPDDELERHAESLVETVVLQLAEWATGDTSLARELLSMDNAGMNLMHYTCMYNYARLVPVLLNFGANPRQPTTRGLLPLQLAAGTGAVEVVECLLRAGARARQRDSSGLTAAERAFAGGHVQLASRLQRAAGTESPHDDDDSLMTSAPRAGVGTWLGDDGDAAGMGGWFDSGGTGGEGGRADVVGSDSSSGQHGGGVGMSPYSQGSLSPVPAQGTPLSPTMAPDSASGSGAGGITGISAAAMGGARDREALAEAFSSLSLKDRMAISLSLGRDGDGRSVGSDGEGVDVSSVLSESEHVSLLEALSLMNDGERAELEDEARVIQTNVRGWMYRRNYRTMRDATKTLQAATRGMLARKTFNQTRQAMQRLQAATRGMLARRNFLQARRQAMAAMVIQRSILQNARRGTGAGAGAARGAGARGTGLPETVPEGSVLDLGSVGSPLPGGAVASPLGGVLPPWSENDGEAGGEDASDDM